MDHKSDKVEEPTAPYVTKKVNATASGSKDSEQGVKYADLDAVRERNAKLMKTHHKVLNKLAQ